MAKKKRVPGYLLHKGTGQAMVRLNGKTIYLGKHGTKESHAEYDRIIQEWLVSGRSTPQSKTSTGPYMCELLAAYLDHAESYYIDFEGNQTRTLEQSRALIRYLKETYSRHPAKEFGPLALQAFRAKLVNRIDKSDDDEKKPKRLSRYYINRLIAETQRIFKWAASQEIVPVEVYQALMTVKPLQAGRTEAPETDPVEPVPDEIIEKTLPHMNSVVAAMVRFQRYTGARPGEVCQLRPCDIDRSGDVWLFRPATHKTAWRGKTRIIPIGPRAQAVLMPYLDREETDYCFSPAEAMKEREREMRRNRKSKVQPSQKCRKKPNPKRKPGIRYKTGSYTEAIKRACKKAKVEPWSANQLRHTAATEIRAVADLETARAVLGHSDKAMTEHYARMDIKKAAEIAARIG